LFSFTPFLGTSLWATDCFICHESTRHWHCYLTTRRLGFIALFVRIERRYDIAVVLHSARCHWVTVTVTAKRSSVMTSFVSSTSFLIILFINNSSNTIILQNPPLLRILASVVGLDLGVDPSERELSAWIFPICPRIHETDLQQRYVALKSVRAQPIIGVC